MDHIFGAGQRGTTTMKNNSRQTLVVIGLIAGMAIFGIAVHHGYTTERPITSTGDFLDPDVEPLYSSTEAISKTLFYALDGHGYHGFQTRLILRNDILTYWYGSTDVELVSQFPTSPIWLVGMLGSGLVVSDTLRLPGGTSLSDDPTPVEGLYVMWDANSGDIVMTGPLETGSLYTYDMILAMPNRQLTILHATAIPGLHPPTPTP